MPKGDVSLFFLKKKQRGGEGRWADTQPVGPAEFGKKFARAGHRRRVVVVRRILSAPVHLLFGLAYEIAQLDFSLCACVVWLAVATSKGLVRG